MTFISYAQNYEDVMLWRALKHVSNGFYIDVGAMSPDFHSVTKLFSEHGWRGINIEPNPEFYRLLKKKRSKDINIQMAISDVSGFLEMSFITGTGLSTLLDNIAEQHKATGFKINKNRVPTDTLENLLNEYVPENKDIHFLKVDVEGFEETVLRSNNWHHYRPWIVLAEATLPLSKIESYEKWEGILISADYKFVYADGLNRYYVAKEHPELFDAFNYPPNVFDDFTPYLQDHYLNLKNIAEGKAHTAEGKAHTAENLARSIKIELDSIHNSKLWKLTAPLRKASLASRKLNSAYKKNKSLLRKRISKVIYNVTYYFQTNKKFKHLTSLLLAKLGLYNKIHELYHHKLKDKFPLTKQNKYLDSITFQQIENPSAHASNIYSQFKDAISNNQKEKH